MRSPTNIYSQPKKVTQISIQMSLAKKINLHEKKTRLLCGMSLFSYLYQLWKLHQNIQQISKRQMQYQHHGVQTEQGKFCTVLVFYVGNGYQG